MGHPLRNWLARHRNPVSFWLHMLGIPATIVLIPLAIAGYWLVGLALFVAGYALQFIGHAIEGNRSGEELLIRRLLRRPGRAPAAKPAQRRPRRRYRR